MEGVVFWGGGFGWKGVLTAISGISLCPDHHRTELCASNILRCIGTDAYFILDFKS